METGRYFGLFAQRAIELKVHDLTRAGKAGLVVGVSDNSGIFKAEVHSAPGSLKTDKDGE